jgi:hypothetical protein
MTLLRSAVEEPAEAFSGSWSSLLLGEVVVWIEPSAWVLVKFGRLLHGAGGDVGFFDLLLDGDLVEFILGQRVFEQRCRDRRQAIRGFHGHKLPAAPG